MNSRKDLIKTHEARLRSVGLTGTMLDHAVQYAVQVDLQRMNAERLAKHAPELLEALEAAELLLTTAQNSNVYTNVAMGVDNANRWIENIRATIRKAKGGEA